MIQVATLVCAQVVKGVLLGGGLADDTLDQAAERLRVDGQVHALTGKQVSKSTLRRNHVFKRGAEGAESLLSAA